MADIKEAIRRMIYQYVVQGADQVKTTQQAIAASTTTTDKAALSLEKTFGNLERRYISTVRQQQDYQKIQDKVNAAVAQNPALQERANAVLAAASVQYNQATATQRAFAVATSGVSAQLTALAAGAGPVGTFLSALGPWGIAAAVGLGAITAVFDKLNEGAKRIGDKSIELKKFSDVTGMAVTEIKGLTKAGGQLGISSEEMTTAVERFSVGLNEARKGTGDLFDKVREINPALAMQLAETKNTAQGWDVLAKAIAGVTDASQRAALARAAFGRGGIEVSLAALATDAAGGIAAMGDKIAQTTGLTQQWVAETARLRAENIALEKSIASMTDAAYALPMLQRQNEFLRGQKEIAEEALRFKEAMDDIRLPEWLATLFGAPEGGGGRGISESTLQAQEEAPALREAYVAQKALTQAREDEQAALIRSNNLERERLGLLGAAATETERMTLRINELKAAEMAGTISTQDFNRAVGALGKTTVEYQQTDYELSLQGVKSQRQRTTAIKESTDQQRIYSSEAITSSQNMATASENLVDSANRRASANRQAAEAAEQEAFNMEMVARAAQRALDAVVKFVPLSAFNIGSGAEGMWQSNQGGYSQFNPKGYTMKTTFWTQMTALSKTMYGAGGFDPETFVPNAQGIEFQFNKMVTKGGGNIGSAVGEMLSGGLMGPQGIDTDKMGLLSRAIDLLPKEQQAGPIQQMIGQLGAAPPTLQTAELIKQLNEKLQQLSDATSENTSATSAMTDVLSPFYSQDPRRTHLGFRAFAGGGIMTEYGALPLRQYQGGGMATSPQVAVFGEGATPEAYVPVPSGRIPVEIKTPANSNQRPVHVTINVMGNASPDTVAALKATAFQQAQTMRRVMG